MKLIRWAAAGASAYVIYKYVIGKKTKGEAVFKSPEADGADAAPAKPKKPARKPATRKPRKAGKTIG